MLLNIRVSTVTEIKCSSIVDYKHLNTDWLYILLKYVVDHRNKS